MKKFSINPLALLAFMFLVNASPAAFAQQELEQKSQQELIGIIQAQQEALDDLAAQLRQADTPLLTARQEVLTSYYAALTQQNQTIVALLQKQESVFNFQDHASYAILIIVILICTAGVVFSYLELENARSAGKSNITVGVSGIQITSALSGILVLTLSLGFLYLFLDRVYEIDEVRVPTINQPQGG